MRIKKVLVANRGEIARRVIRTCRTMGIRTVAVFSDADRAAPFVREADEAIRIGPAPSIESYLRVDAILAAAARTGADAIHPGYGFLSENAGFARACADAKVVFIGPPISAIEKMGKKREAKQIAINAGVPVVPGYDGSDQDPAVLAERAAQVGFPVLLKASAGGGGKGMRVVSTKQALPAAIESAKREAQSSFGDGTLLIERYVEKPRHVEIQILGDQHGNLVHLFERECSIQRRYQKIIEEAPSPALDAIQRAQMGEAAVKLGAAIGYTHAGTVEFILTPTGEFYFLEVNTRLQVEHPVTECITGLDLVREQIRIAQGEPLGYTQDDLEPVGAAIEVRLYAEDPANRYLPATGRLTDYHIPDHIDVRDDSGVETGFEVGIHYDPMLSKLITYAPTRDEALDKARYALQELSVHGVTTNRELLLGILDHPDFRAGRIDTHFLERHSHLLIPGMDERRLRERDFAALAAAMAMHEERRRSRRVLESVPTGYRNNPFADQWVEYRHRDHVIRVQYHHQGRGRFRYRIGERAGELTILSHIGCVLRLDIDGCIAGCRITRSEARHSVTANGTIWVLDESSRFPELEKQDVAGGCLAPMPGKIIQVKVEVGQTVKKGEVLVVMEAMKMEHTVTAPEDGVIEELRVKPLDQVDSGQVLVRLRAG